MARRLPFGPLFDADLFDPLIFDTDDPGHFLRKRRRRGKTVDYEHLILSNVRR